MARANTDSSVKPVRRQLSGVVATANFKARLGARAQGAAPTETIKPLNKKTLQALFDGKGRRQELADAVEVNKATIANIKDGGWLKKLTQLKQLSEALGLTIEQFVNSYLKAFAPKKS